VKEERHTGQEAMWMGCVEGVQKLCEAIDGARADVETEDGL
jgi:hypothetical protein